MRSWLAADMTNSTLGVLAPSFCGVVVGFAVGEAAPWMYLPLCLLAGLTMGLYYASGKLRRREIVDWRAKFEQIREEQEKLAAELSENVERWAAANNGATLPAGTLVGKVIVKTLAEGGDLTGAGMIDAEIQQRCEDGHWHSANSAGPLAVIFEELAGQLRRQAMNEAGDD